MGCHIDYCILDLRCFQCRIMAVRIWDNRNRYVFRTLHTVHNRAKVHTGLSWKESLGIVALAFFIISFVIAANGAIGVIHHAPFPVLARASWGFWGSYIAIISRAILAIFWFAIQTMNGANTVRVMLGAIWPSFLTMKNHIPAEQGIETNTMISFFLFWLAQIPFLYMHPNNLRWLFMAKSVIVPIAWIAILGWAFSSTDGGEMWNRPATITGSAYSWAFLSSLTSVIGNYATLSVNQACIPFLSLYR
jgi:NCS1 family nucleobase:cation symporter-1